MNERLRVYELDTDELMAQVESTLVQRGYDVREQIPAGVWWFRTDAEPEAAAEEIAGLFRDLVVAHLRTVEQ
jgi:hypothetical protein